MTSAKTRCGWVPLHKPYYVDYHDSEWGVPVHDDRHLFEMLILEGAQAGLSWDSILKRREGYRAAFHQFDIIKASQMSDGELEQVLKEGDIIRNRLKVFSVRKNALAVLQIQKEFGSLDAFLWSFVGGKPQVLRPASMKEVRITSPESDAMAKALKKRGMSFVGSTILYAYMQAVGMVDEHMRDCFCAKVA